ncbi:hypothetical protein ACWJJH_16185 [Endozoicomonadaceae bacterium StTr2]
MFLEAFDSDDNAVFPGHGDSSQQIIDHLSLLLGSRRAMYPLPPLLQATNHSLPAWGVPCLRQGCISGDPVLTCSVLQQLIATFEPRLEQVSVEITSASTLQATGRSYRIHGICAGTQQAEDIDMSTRIVEFDGRLVVEDRSNL